VGLRQKSLEEIMNRSLSYKFRFSHDLCVSMLYELIEILDYGQESGIYDVHLDIDKKEIINGLEIPSKLSGVALFDWLERNGFNKEIQKMVFVSLFKGILLDFCNFLFEALNCSEKGKISIAYALLRKPLRENLYYLERMLSDTELFVTKFLFEEATKLNMNHVKDKKQVMFVLEKVLEKLPNKIYNLDLIYRYRFDKNFDAGLECNWNQAHHLVTTKEKLITPKGNLNFIFAEETIEDLHKFWHHIYHSLPYLLMWTVDIAEALLLVAAEQPLPKPTTASCIRRGIGYLLHQHERDCFRLNDKEVFDLKLICVHCETEFPPSPVVYYNFFELQKSTCLNCQKEVSLLDIINYYNIVNKEDDENNN
jgi:hypothetical protein